MTSPGASGRGSPRGLCLAAYGAGALATLIGAYWLTAWLTGAAAMRAASGVVIMKTNAALALVLAGTGMVLLAHRPDGWRRWAGWLAGVVVLLIGALTLGEHLFACDLGIDQILATEQPGAAGTISPNRVGPPASTSFMLLGAGLLALARRRPFLVPYLGLAVCLISLGPSVGFLYGINPFYTQPRLTAIAWPTVIALISLGLGLMLSEPERGPLALLRRDDPGGAMLRRLLPVAILLPLALGLGHMLASNHDLYERRTGTGLLVMTLIVVFSAVLYHSAARLSRSGAAQRQAQEALRRSQERLEFALETSHTGAWDLDLDTHVAYRSLQHDRIFGYKELLPQWTYEMLLEHVVPEDRPAVDASFREAAATQSDWSFECRIRRADGEVRWIWAAGRHRTAVPSGPRLMSGIVQDITERKRAELDIGQYTAQLQATNASLQGARKAALNLMQDALQARKQAEEANANLRSLAEQRRLALEAADMGAWDYHFQTGEVFWDERCRQMWGMAQAEHVDYSTAISRILPEDRAGVDAAVQEALRGLNDGTYHRQFRVVWPDGSVHWIASHGRVYFEGVDKERHPVRFIGANLDVTAEQQAKEALRESRERLATLAAATFEGIVLSEGGVVVDCNQQLAHMLGCPAQEIKGRRIEDFIAPEDQARVMQNIRAGRDSVIEHRMLRPDGSCLTVEAHGRSHAHSGRRQRHTAIRDITERKQREELLERLNRTLRALKDSSQAMMRAATETMYLEEVCRILTEDCGHVMVWIGLAEDDEAQTVRPVAWSGFEEGYLQTLQLTWADNERGRGPTGTAIRTGNPALCRNMLTDDAFAPWRDEALKRGYASSLTVPLLEEAAGTPARRRGQRKGFGAIVLYSRLPDAFSEDEVNLLLQLAEDVSYGLRVLRLREARAHAERRTQLLAHTASRLLVAESPQHVVGELCHEVLAVLDCQVFFNYLAEEPAGASVAESEAPGAGGDWNPAAPGDGRTPRRLRLNACAGIPAEEARRIEWLDYGSAVCGCAARDGCRIVVENVQQAADPRADMVRSFGVQAYACHPLAVGGQVLGTLSFGTRTRTRFGEKEVALMKAVADLVSIAIERQRAQASLQTTAQDLKRSNLDLEQFAYVASHDLQEPLRAVSGYVQLLARRLGEALDSKGQEYVAGAVEGAMRMEQLISDLLSFSRVGTRGARLALTNLEVPLGQALRNLDSSLRSVEGAVTHDPLPTLTVDATQVMQVFQNLIGNAIKFRGAKPPRIHVGAAQEKGRWVVSVRDNGIGIAPQYYERIFQLFQRLHTRTAYPGTGIGLALCKRIIERHGGTIWLESQPGKGSTFYFTIPDGHSAR